MADAIEVHFGSRPELIAGSGGVFDVVADGSLIYSKADTGRFPEPGEVLGRLGSKS